MASEEMTSAHMKLTESKKLNLEKSMLSLLVNWKDLDQHFNSTHRCLDDKFNQLESKENQLLSIQKSLAESNRELDLLRNSIEDRVKLVERKEKELQVLQHQLVSVFSLKQQSLNSMEESLKERIKDVEMREEELQVLQPQHVNDFSLKPQKLNSMEESLKERIKEVEMREEALERRLSEIERRSREVRSKEEIFNHALQFNICTPVLDAKCLLKVLNQYECSKNTIYVKSGIISTFLRLSSDPAKLVLDAVKEGFYVWGTEFPKIIVWRNRFLYLEQLTVLSPEIETPVRVEALAIASEWEAKIRETANGTYLETKIREKINGPWEALGFLHLLAAYKLTSDFTVDKLLNVVERVATHEQTPELLRLIGLEEKVPVLIKKLIEKEQRLVAMRYILEFDLIDLFPPVPLLDSHFIYLEAMANKIRYEEPYSPTAQARASEVELDSLVDVAKWVMDNIPGPRFSPENILAVIKKSKEDDNMTRSFRRSVNKRPRRD